MRKAVAELVKVVGMNAQNMRWFPEIVELHGVEPIRECFCGCASWVVLTVGLGESYDGQIYIVLATGAGRMAAIRSLAGQ